MKTTVFLQGNPDQSVTLSGKNQDDLKAQITSFLQGIHKSNLVNCTNFFAGRSRVDGHEIDQVITIYLPPDAPESWTISSNIFGELFQSVDQKDAIDFFAGACVLQGEIYF
jgi:hypothetical protein